MLTTAKLRVITQPCPAALYFKNIRRGPIGALQTAVRQSLPSWALLRMAFVGGTVLEIATDYQLKQRLIATLKFMGITNLPIYSIYQGNRKNN